MNYCCDDYPECAHRVAEDRERQRRERDPHRYYFQRLMDLYADLSEAASHAPKSSLELFKRRTGINLQ